MEKILGLYVSVAADGRIRWNLTTRNGEVKLKASTVNAEIIEFSELNFKPYAAVVDLLSERVEDMFLEAVDEEHAGEPYVSVDAFQGAMQIVYDLLDELEKENPLYGTLTRLMLEDAVPPDDGSAWWMIRTAQTIVERLSSIMQLQFLVNDALYDIRNGTSPDLQSKHAFFVQAEVPQILSLGKKLTAQVRFRSPIEYYRFLMMRFLANTPNVALCECCGRYFIPKTRRRTLYCDRKIRGNKTCKDLAPALKHRREAGRNEVIRAYDRANQRMYKRYEREADADHHLPKGIHYSDYYDWRDKAAAARDAFLNGTITAEEALKLIEA
ncbi:MAG: hypothetical protein IJ766_08855 [Clostridia bacterium]|nr:hypothetical protein [Clostridia bacterium]